MNLEATSIGPYFVVTCVLLRSAELAACRVPFYRDLLNGQREGRFVAIDGLRGFLAFAVFFHHAVITYFHAQTGVWDFPPSRFYAALGPVGVALFFMITGLLFWDKVLARGGRLDTQGLYRSRLRRIVPMYLVSVALVLAVVAVESGFRLRVPVSSLRDAVIDWLGFGIEDYRDVNGVVDTRLINASVFWTLSYEWAFYLFLPAMAYFHSPKAFAIMLALVWVYLVHRLGYAYVLCFMAGMGTAMLLSHRPMRSLLCHPLAGVVALVALAAVFRERVDGMSHSRVALLGVFFVIVAHGNTLFGLFASRGARMLGAISYSTYLLHGIVLHVAARLVPMAELSGLGFWGFTLAVGVLVMLVSALTYRFVEHPFLRPSSARARVSGAPPAVAYAASPVARS